MSTNSSRFARLTGACAFVAARSFGGAAMADPLNVQATMAPK